MDMSFRATQRTATKPGTAGLSTFAGPAIVSVHNVSVDERAGTVTFTLDLDKPVSQPFSVAYSTIDGSALAGSDFIGVSGGLTFAPGQTSKTVVVAILDDALLEVQESFTLRLGPLGGDGAGSVLLGDVDARAVIGASDRPAAAAAAFTVSFPIVGENAGYAEFVVTRSAPSLVPVSVSYYTVEGSAGAADYTNQSGTLVFAPGVTTQTVRIPITDDALPEATEIVTLVVSNASDGSAPKVGVVTIVDNDTVASASHPATLIVRDVEISEGEGIATFTVELDKALPDTVSLTFASLARSARPGRDYLPIDGVLTFAAGDMVKTVSINLLDDPWAEGAESFQLAFGAVTGPGASALLPTVVIANATIRDNDASNPAASFAVVPSTISAQEGDTVTLRINTTGIAAGVELAYAIENLDSGRLKQPLTGFATVDAGGHANVRLDFVNNGHADSASIMHFVLLDTGAGADIAVRDVGTGSPLADMFTNTAGNDAFDGGAGVDTVVYGGSRAGFAVTKTAAGFQVQELAGAKATDQLIAMERLQFGDTSLALDVNGNGGQAYRLYQAAFDRAPDLDGLGYWIAQHDRGSSLEEMAFYFIKSQEFTAKFGSNLSDTGFVTAMYANALHRAPEAAGAAYWNGVLADGESRAHVLQYFSESPENQAKVIGQIQNGFEYHPFV